MMDHELELRLRREVVQVCRLMYQKDLIAATDGNESVRLGDSLLLATPSGLPKGFIEAQDMVVTDLRQVVPEDVAPANGHRPSAELWLHLAAYRQGLDCSRCGACEGLS